MDKSRQDVRIPAPDLWLRGVAIHSGFLDRVAQEAMVADLRAVARVVPFQRMVTPSGRRMSVRMTAAGQFGWVSDRQGYRYAPTHLNGTPWPAIPPSILSVWEAVSGSARTPECCLINFYDADAKMGMHQDKDEADPSEPVVSISLGDSGRFRVGSVTRGGTTESLWLSSGDVAVMGGAARLIHHGVDRIKAGSSTLLPDGGRINITLRVVT
ncbi:alpha-ketoglutarate-dependent dioxygenase AlkB family protein [Dinoroseobacter sp. S375]|uniref:alpha-ketoglutarate-dependent dioxygenase AlkB family protein n=1 Tax=Dinoroseobacter sp. S375 TaxID=3415136 RepID=UPI003C7E3BCC